MRRHAPALLLLPLTLTACTPPPPAPEGLDDATSYLVREFYAEDALFEAGLVGFMNWFEDEGFELAGERANSDNTDAFTVGDLLAGDVEQLPLVHGHDVEAAAGVVSIAVMECDLATSEDLLARPDQFNVFAGDWTTYERSYTVPREPWQAATTSGQFDPVNERLNPYGDDGQDLTPWARTFMQTENRVDPEPEFGGLADLNEYDLFLDFRHGVYDLGGEELAAFAILSFQVDSVPNPAGDAWLHQTYALEINVEQPGDTTLRMLAVWSELEGAGLSSDTTLVLNLSVNKALASSERISGICSGEFEIPD